MFWTMQGERGPFQKALVSRSWRGPGMVIWLEGMGSVHKAELTSWSVTMTTHVQGDWGAGLGAGQERRLLRSYGG